MRACLRLVTFIANLHKGVRSRRRNTLTRACIGFCGNRISSVNVSNSSFKTLSGELPAARVGLALNVALRVKPSLMWAGGLGNR